MRIPRKSVFLAVWLLLGLSVCAWGKPLFEDDHKTEKAQAVAYERQVQELYAEIGKLTTQLAWLKKKSGLDPFER